MKIGQNWHTAQHAKWVHVFVCVCKNQQTYLVLLVQKKEDGVVTVDKTVIITCSRSAKLTKTAQLCLEAEGTFPPLSAELCPPAARMRNCII
jgi:hypothetical protein